MKNRFIVLLSLFGLAVVLVQSINFIDARASASKAKFRRATAQRASLSEHISLHAAGRGNPFISLADGHELQSTYIGTTSLAETLDNEQTSPTDLASADFDEDGVPDLICGYGNADGGSVTLHRGNPDTISANTPQARRHRAEAVSAMSEQQRASGDYQASPFLPEARVFDMPEWPDFIGAGDFDADGHADVVAAARGSNEFYLLRGDGRGGLGQAQPITLSGKVTVMVTGEINRRDGLLDVVISVVGTNGPQALVFEGPEGALLSQPEIFALPAEATALALAQLDDDYYSDLAIAAGSELLIAHGRDRRLSLDKIRQAEVPHALIERSSLEFQVASLAVGNFDGHAGNDLALLSESGQLHLLRREAIGTDKRTTEQTANTEQREGKFVWKESNVLDLSESAIGWASGSSPRLVAARVSSLPGDHLLVVDSNNHQLHILVSGAATETPPRAATLSASASLRVATSLDVEGEPIAALPIRLNKHALNDLVILRKGKNRPVVALAAPGAIITVNDTADTNTRDTLLTLREAMLVANGTLAVGTLTGAEQAQVIGTPATPGLDEIRFFISGSGVKTISPTSVLPTITDPLTIDGYTQPGASANTLSVGSNAVLLIELDGTNVGGLAIGLDLAGGTSTVRGLVINRFGSPSTSLGSGAIQIESDNNVVAGNFLGSNAAGTAALGSERSFGVNINSGANSLIGGTTPADRNIFAGTASQSSQSGGTGLNIQTNNAGTRVQGNYIGTNANGSAALGLGRGINVIGFASADITIGGLTPTPGTGAGNVISGNSSNGSTNNDGIFFATRPGDLSIQGNIIGLNAAGTTGLPNGVSGINLLNISSGTSALLIGGTATGARNVIFNNQITGIVSRALGLTVQGNFIGTDITGTFKPPSPFGGGIGLSIGGSATIGGASAAARNLISCHGLGLEVFGAPITVRGNYFGTAADGVTPLGNDAEAVRVESDAVVTIGGTGTGEGNVIANSLSAGVVVMDTARATIRGNSIYSNVRLGIDFNGDGVTPNDACDADSGPNGLQNFPVITSASGSGASTTIAGTLNSTAGTTFTIDFYANASCDTSGNGEGKTFLGSTTVSTSASPACSGNFNVNLPLALPAGQNVITATATDPSGNTSEFSQCFTVPVGCSITCPQNLSVNTGPGSTQCGATVQYPAPTTGGSCGTVTCTPSSGSFFAKGTTTVNCTTSSGPSCSFTATVIDNTLPLITCPPNTSAGTSGSCAIVNYGAPTVSDNCPGTTVNCVPPSGTCFAPGTTTVTCTATDTSNNQSSCGFTVTVTQTTCTLACPSNQTANTGPASNQCGAAVTYPAPTAGGQCGTVTCNPPSGSVFAVGTTTVTCTAAAGSSCQFTVTVVDNTKPKITCPSNVTSATSGNCATVSYPTSTVSDNCSASAICSPASGTCFPVGTTTVNCTASDPAGNTAVCSFTVKVTVQAFDVCLQDDSDASIVLLFNTTTGDYVFCCGVRALTGRGTIRKKGENLVLEHNAPDRRVLGNTDRSVHKGKASVQSPAGAIICTIADRDTTNNTCVCSSPAPDTHAQPHRRQSN